MSITITKRQEYANDKLVKLSYQIKVFTPESKLADCRYLEVSSPELLELKQAIDTII